MKYFVALTFALAVVGSLSTASAIEISFNADLDPVEWESHRILGLPSRDLFEEVAKT